MKLLTYEGLETLVEIIKTELSGKLNKSVVSLEYAPTETYSVGDYCIYQQRLYRCSTSIITPEEWTAAHWIEVTLTEELALLNGEKIGKPTSQTPINYVPTSDGQGGYIWAAQQGGGSSQVYTGTISTTWTGSSAPYTQDITVSGILTTDEPIVDLVPSSTFSTAQSEMEDYAKIYKMEVIAANTITVYATDTTSVALTIKLRCIR